MKFNLKTINNEIVEAVPLLDPVDKRPVLGSSLFEEIYANICLCARKKSGKSSVIYNIVKKCADKQTTVIAFVSTLHKDAIWKTIAKHCDKNNIHFIGYTSLKDDRGNDILGQLITELQTEEDILEEPKKKDKLELFDDVDESTKKKKKSKYRSPEYLFIFDDISNELKCLSLMTLIKKNRHFKSKLIISSQYMNDVAPSSRAQLDYLLIFKGITKEKLQNIYADASIGVDEDLFMNLYREATLVKYSFLYIDSVDNSFRINFNKQFILP